jgi:hypothetical protein
MSGEGLQSFRELADLRLDGHDELARLGFGTSALVPVAGVVQILRGRLVVDDGARPAWVFE